jgi:hypothetical protein
MLVLGVEMLQIVCQIVGHCASKLPYIRTLDLIRILMLAVETYKLDSIPVLQIALGPILEKAIQTPIPQSNISDDDRNILHTNQFLVKLLHVSFDILGGHIMFNPSFAPMIDPILKWLTGTQIPQIFDKKNCTKSVQTIKLIFSVLRGNILGTPPEKMANIMFFASKRSKENWSKDPIDLNLTYAIFP